MANLYCLSLGSSMCETWIKAAPQNKKSVLLLPSSFLLHRARTLEHEAASNMNFLSFDELVETIVKQYCQVTFIDRLTQEMIIEEVLAELLASGQLSYFHDIVPFPGYISTVTRLIGEIKRTGILPEEFRTICEARDFPQKDVEVYHIYDHYQKKLQKLQIADLEELYFLAIRALEQGTPIPYQKIYISEFYIFTPLQKEIIRQLHHMADVTIAIAYEKNKPLIYQAAEATYTDLVGMGFEPVYRAMPTVRHDIEIISCPNRYKEMRVVAGKVKELLLTGRYLLGDIAVVARNIKNYQELFNIFMEFGIPLDMPQEESLHNQPLVRLIVNLLTAKQDGGTKETVVNILKSPYITAKFQFAVDDLENFLLDQLIFGWQDWQNVLGQLPDNEERVKILTAFQAVSQTIMHIPHQAVCQKFVAAIKNFIEKLAVPKALAQSYQAGLPLSMVKAGLLTYQKILSVLEKIENDYLLLGKKDQPLTTDDFLAAWIHLMQDEICIKKRDSAGVKLISPEAARGVQFPVVFIMGLSDGEFPARERENWLYKDSERRLLYDLGMDISTLAQKRQLEDLYFYIALSLSKEKLFLTYYEDEKTLPSPYIEQIREKELVKMEKFQIDDVFSKNYLETYSRKELLNSVLAAAFKETDELTVVAGSSLALVDEWLTADFWRKETVERQRQTEASEYSGKLGAKVLTSIFSQHKDYSISSLEDYASCPFNYFAGRILGLSQFSEIQEDTGSDVIGNIYHTVAARFLGRHRGEKLSDAKREAYHAELSLLIAAAVAEVEKNAFVKGRLWNFEKNKINETLQRWLHFEIAEENKDEYAFRPTYFEWGFGIKDDKNTMDPSSTSKPLTMNLSGRSVQIIGKIDRIDVAAGHVYQIFDYKKKYCRSAKEITDGLDLQMPLYLWAVRQHLCGPDDKIVGGVYYSIEQRKKAGGMRLKKNETKWQELNEIVRQYLEKYINGIENGEFAAAPLRCNPYCIAREICRYNKFVETGAEVTGGE